MRATRRLHQKITCDFYDFKSEKELLKYFERESKKTRIIQHKCGGKSDFLISNIRFLKKVKSIKQVDLWGDDSYYYYDNDWNEYTLVLIKVWF